MEYTRVSLMEMIKMQMEIQRLEFCPIELVGHKDEKGKTLLHYFARGGNTKNNFDKPIISAISKFIDINEKDDEGNTPLHDCVSYGYWRSWRIEYLIEKGADINAQNNLGETPLHLSISDIFGGFGTIRADAWNELLASNCNPNIQDKDGNTPLHIAIRKTFAYDTNRVLSPLLNLEGRYGNNNPVDISIKNNEGQTPLQLAEDEGNKTAINFLIEYAAKT